jgi:mono/diheme cytochrome c family protein
MRRSLVPLSTLAASLAIAACGSQGIQLAEDDPNYAGARIFQQRCAACHTLAAAGSEGSAVSVNSREYKDGPNFNQRKESRDQILYAIRNGGFSSSPMPQNIVVGKEAEQVAAFLEKYAGREAAP